MFRMLQRYAAEKEREYLQKYNDVTEGSWVSWLNEKKT